MVTVMWTLVSQKVELQSKSAGLVWELATTWHSVCIHQMNWVNSATITNNVIGIYYSFYHHHHSSLLLLLLILLPWGWVIFDASQTNGSSSDCRLLTDTSHNRTAMQPFIYTYKQTGPTAKSFYNPQSRTTKESHQQINQRYQLFTTATTY